MLLRGKAVALRQGPGAAHAGPETPVGKAVVRLGAVDMVGKLALRDVTDDAQVGGGGLNGMMAVMGAEVAAVPGTTEERGELAGLAAEDLEHCGELLGEQEKAAIGGGLVIPQGMEDAVRCGAGGGDASCGPDGVGIGEEAGDLAPAGSFAGLAGFADQDNEEIEAVTCGAYAAVRDGADEVAEGRQELEEHGSGMGFGVRGKAADGETGEAVERRVGEFQRRGRGGAGGKVRVGAGVFDGVAIGIGGGLGQECLAIGFARRDNGILHFGMLRLAWQFCCKGFFAGDGLGYFRRMITGLGCQFPAAA